MAEGVVAGGFGVAGLLVRVRRRCRRLELAGA